ncbi:MAG: hypothetical protein CO025_11935, partial [Ignavibacteria bacterium CG_4_9_14_0_2_um_filter_37_13]
DNGIYKTTDGGSTWIAYFGTSAGFIVNSISFSDTLNGWCVGDDGTRGLIIHTTDGGKTWALQLDITDRVYSAIKAFSSTKAIVAGNYRGDVHISTRDTGKILLTEDAGKTWTEKTLFDSVDKYKRLQFLDSLNGFMWGNNCMKTRDGGKTWEKLPRFDQALTASFIDTLHGWGGYGYVMFKTTDGGMTWNYLSYLDQPEQLSMADLKFVDSLNGWAFGITFYEGVVTDAIFRTTDGGNNWYREAVALSQRPNHMYDGFMLNKNLGWAVCAYGEVLKYQLLTSAIEKLPKPQPNSFTLRQNYPNPFNPTTFIEYELQLEQIVTIVITDALGKTIQTLINGEEQALGVYRIKFDGSSLASGVYYYTIKTENFTDTKQMLLIK